MMSTTFSATVEGHHFNFQPFEINQETGYHVDVKNDEGKRWEFRMLQNEQDEWLLEGENLPAWVTDAKTSLINAIREHE